MSIYARMTLAGEGDIFADYRMAYSMAVLSAGSVSLAAATFPILPMFFVKQARAPTVVGCVASGLMYWHAAERMRTNRPYGYEMGIGASVLLMGVVARSALELHRHALTLSVLGGTYTVYYAFKLYEERCGRAKYSLRNMI